MTLVDILWGLWLEDVQVTGKMQKVLAQVRVVKDFLQGFVLSLE